jgi:FAD/FMN-containing dehydrogenase
VLTVPGFRGAWRTDVAARAAYAEGAGIYRILPTAVAVPADTDDLVTLVRWAGDESVALVPRGAGSGMAGGNVGPGVVVDLTRGFRTPCVVDPAARRVRCGASVTWREIDQAARAHQLFLPPDPASGAFCTIGGMVATNAAGARSFKYGAVRAWVEALEFVTADGEVGRADRSDLRKPRIGVERRLLSDVAPYLRQHQRPLEESAPRTRKNSSGYCLVAPDNGWVRHLLIGSEGTLAFVTTVELALEPLPRKDVTVLVPVRSLEELPGVLEAIRESDPVAVELLDRTYLEFVRAADERIPASTEAVVLARLADDAEPSLLHGVGIDAVLTEDPVVAAELWNLRHLASPILARLPDPRRSLQVVEDGCVPLGRLPAYIGGLRKLAAEYGYQVVIFGHAGDGHVHANLLVDGQAEDLAPRMNEFLRQVTNMQLALGGTTSGEHGDGRLRAPFLERLYGGVYVEACRRVKAAFDPAGILNPGVKLATGPSFTADTLKVGRDAPAIPPDIAQQLRDMERNAGWGALKLDLAPEPALR